MRGWLSVVQVLLVLVALAVVALGLLALRQRWLARQGGTFECSLRLLSPTPSTDWVLGVARYQGGLLQWFRFFSYALGPRHEFTRDDIRILDSRSARPAEAVALGPDQRILRITAPEPLAALEGPAPSDAVVRRHRASGELIVPGAALPVGPRRALDWAPREWELAMNSDAMTGLLSWLEAAPPGIRTSD